jgi:transposase
VLFYDFQHKTTAMARIHTWAISDEFWTMVEPLVPKSRRDPDKTYTRKTGGGKKPTYSDRLYFSGIVYVLRTGVIWNAFPRKQFEGLGSSALHTRFKQWEKAGFFTAIWRMGLAEYNELSGISWKWQAADGTNVEAPLARESVGPNPTDRGKKWKQKAHVGRRAWSPAVVCRQRGKCP